jgi:signal transduction histidine kinase
MSAMTSSMKFRLVAFILTIALLVSLVVWAAFTATRRAEDSRTQMAAVQSESFRIAAHFQEGIVGLNQRLLQFVAHRDTNVWNRFEREWNGLNEWIDGQHLAAPAEKKVLGQLNAAYDDYHEAALQIERRVETGRGGGMPVQEFENLQRQAARVSELTFQLAEAHRQTLIASLAGSTRTVGHFQALLLGALFLILAFGALLAHFVYKEMIAPLQVKLVESQALLERQEKLASLGTLAAGVAHEIRNPLTAIKAWLFMHQKRLQRGSTEEADAEVIANEIDRLERIVKDFLLFARPSEPQLRAVPAEQPLREVRDLMVRQLEKQNIRLVLELSAKANIRADPQQLKQVLINLVQNAADAIGQNGCVTLRTRVDRYILVGRETHVVVLEVGDTGKGISPEVEKRLFDPFFSTKETGTGLGLSIAAGIVQKHGGVLQYQTQINHGTTFGIVLPLAGDQRENG